MFDQSPAPSDELPQLSEVEVGDPTLGPISPCSEDDAEDNFNFSLQSRHHTSPSFFASIEDIPSWLRFQSPLVPQSKLSKYYQGNGTLLSAQLQLPTIIISSSLDPHVSYSFQLFKSKSTRTIFHPYPISLQFTIFNFLDIFIINSINHF